MNILFDRIVAGELVKNIGLGVFINELYGLTDGSFELYNFVDMFFGFVGINLERNVNE